jgi:hypothetical protein
MLGRIDFKPWQCLAELVDNGVDAFLDQRRQLGDDERGRHPSFPQVNIELSSVADIRSGAAELRVTDNGPGMSPDFLTDAVRAGYSSNDSADKLGLFGMGFNVATARMGNRTEVWTTREEDDSWFGVRIDFDEIERSGSFLVPALKRRKITGEGATHGTQVIVTKLERERALYLRSGGGMRSTREKLSRVYNKIMREIGLEIAVVGTPLVSREFCVWSEARHVATKGDFGRVPARLVIDADLGSRLYCEDCWVWLEDHAEESCPVCGKSDRLTRRERQVTGWLGIQRFFDQADYGIDLIRNGRVIEERSKNFFYWRDPETDEAVIEYPLEQTHWGGRIVGELSLDFVPLASHQKDAFDKTTREWRLVEEAVRGKGPIIQKYRQQSGLLDRNFSPLARLHAGFRRGQPAGLRWLVPGDAKDGRGINRPAQQWAELFWEGNPDYQTDDKWYEAALAAEAAQQKGAPVPEALSGAGAFPGGGADDDLLAEGLDVDGEAPLAPAAVEPQREGDPALSGSYDLQELPGAPRLDVTSERITTGSLPQQRAVQFAAVASRIEFLYDPHHDLFVQSLLEPVDCLVEELGYQFLARSSTTQTQWPLSVVTELLRAKYFAWSVQSFDATRDASIALVNELIEFFTESLAPLEGQLADTVTAEERQLITHAVARLDHLGEDRVALVIEKGEYPRYLGPRGLPRLVEQWPELILDGNFFVLGYADVDPAEQDHIVREIVTPLRDVLWAANPDAPSRGGTEWRIRLGRAFNSLRLLETWKVSQ